MKLLFIACCLFSALATCVVLSQGSLSPTIELDDYVYKEDPCVEALRGAMEKMEPYLPINPKWQNGY